MYYSPANQWTVARRLGPRIVVPRFTQPPPSLDPIPPPVPHYVIPGSHLLDPPFNEMDDPPIWTTPAPGTPGTSNIPEAPMDGLIYGRQDGAWVEISQATSGIAADVTGEWQVVAQTTASDPGNGKVKFNTDTQGDATEIYLSARSVGGTDMSNWLMQNPEKVFIQRKNDSARIGRWNIISITGNTTWFFLTVTPEGAATGFPMAGNDAVIILFRW